MTPRDYKQRLEFLDTEAQRLRDNHKFFQGVTWCLIFEGYILGILFLAFMLLEAL